MNDANNRRIQRVGHPEVGTDAATLEILLKHVLNKENPHNVSPDQLKALKRSVFDILINSSEEFSKSVMSFLGVDWAQFGFFDTFGDSLKRATDDPSSPLAVVADGTLVTADKTADAEYGFVSKTYSDINILDSGTSSSVGTDFLADTSKSWWANQLKGLTLVDSASSEFTIISNTADQINVDGDPAAGAYSITCETPSLMTAFAYYNDSTLTGYGHVKLEVSFDGGSNYQTLLDTENTINYLMMGKLISNPGVDVQIRITLKNDAAGRSPEFYNFLIVCDPSLWRW